METIPPPTPYVPSDVAKELYGKHVAQAWTDQQASSDAFDNNLLTFSSAALGLSVGFIKDVVPLESAEWMRTLYLSWVCFTGCILVTIASFQFAAQAQRIHVKYLKEYYLDGDETALNKSSWWSRALPWCSVVGTALLLIGVVSTLMFASKNITHYKETRAWQTTMKAKK